MFSREYVLRQIDLELAYGIKDFEITGGEPSECVDLEYYCKYIKSKSPNSKIAIITNGSLYSNVTIWNYIDEVLVSYHLSKNITDYDKNIFPLGSTYNKVKKTIDIAKQNNKIVRTNTVIGTFNTENLYDIINDLIEFTPDIINFLPVNIFDDATQMGQYIDYIKLRPILKKSIDILKSKLNKTLIFIRYMPFCDMVGYEQHILGTLQHMYDWFDWNPELCGQYLLDYLNTYKTNEEILKYLGKFGTLTFDKSYDCVKAHYEKDPKCMTCKYYFICDGVEKVSNHILLNHIQPEHGTPIKNIMYYINDDIYKFYMAKYNV